MTPDPTNGSLDESVSLASVDAREEPTAVGFNPRELLAIIRRRWILILTVFAIVTAIGAWRTTRQPRIYEATATVRFQQPTPAVQGIGQQQIRSFGIDPLQSEQLLIRSQSVAERAAMAAGLRLRVIRPPQSRLQLFGDSVPHVDSLARNGEYRLEFARDSFALAAGGTRLGAAPYGTRLNAAGLSLFVPAKPDMKENSVALTVGPLESAAMEVRGGTTTRVIPQTDVIEITFRGTDPGTVRDVANSLASAYAQFSSELQTTSARNKTQFIQNALANQKEGLDAAQQRLQAFKETHQISDVSAEATALFTNVHELEGLKQAAIVDRSVYEQLLGKLTQADTVDDDLRKLAGTEAITKNTYVANLYNRWFDLLKTREEIMATGKNANDRDVQATDKLIARTKRDLQEASRVYLDGLESRLASYDKSIAESRREAERFPPLESEQARLTADVRTTQTAYDNLLAQLQLARIAESADGATVRVVDAASLPAFAVAPIRRRAIIFAMFLGLAIGIALAIGLEKLDDSVKSPDELPQRFDLPVLGQIPSIRATEKQDAPGLAQNRLVTHADPRSVVAEAYRSLRTNIAFARAQSRARTLVFTSPGPADGKSTTVANLAITFAQQGQRTLLIDGDLRRAVLDKTFSVPRTPGLTELIVGVAALADAVHETPVENLFVMGSGQLPPNPSELLGSDRMREVIAEARESFDVVLFDSPPLLAVTDAAVLSTMVDGAVLVVRMGTTSREAVRRAAAHLRAVHSRILGAVMNDIDISASGYYGSYGYYYYAYQSHDGDRSGDSGSRGRGRIRKMIGLGRDARG